MKKAFIYLLMVIVFILVFALCITIAPIIIGINSITSGGLVTFGGIFQFIMVIICSGYIAFLSSKAIKDKFEV